MRKVVINKVVKLTAVKRWLEEDTVRELEKQCIDKENLSFDGFIR